MCRFSTRKRLSRRPRPVPRFKDIIDQRFGLLVAVERVGTCHGQALWLCQCDCGGTREYEGHTLRRGAAQSCGCLRLKNCERMVEIRRVQSDNVPRCSHLVSPRKIGKRMCNACFARWNTYGITPAQWETMLDDQAGLCGVCTQPMSPGTDTHLDHCHTTKQVRMILCKPCNTLLGAARDSSLILDSASSYIKAFAA